MIKLTNGEATAFNSPVAASLFSDKDRQFPIEAAFKLSDIIQQIGTHQKAYAETFRGIVDKHSGTIHPDGRVEYPSEGNQKVASEEIEKLNSVFIEIPGDKLEVTDEWPKLTLVEATILKPVIQRKG